MKSARTFALGLSIILMMTAATPLVFAQAAHVRWDIISLNFATGTVSPGGVATAIAQDGSHIRLTGSGTFVAPSGGDGTSSATTGGGAWAVFAAGALTPSATGTYVVTGLVRWDQAPGTFPANVDAIDEVTEAHAGLAVLRVEFSDGTHGVLVVSCHFNGTPNSVFEGIRVSKGYVDYWNGTVPIGGVNANRTAFHVN